MIHRIDVNRLDADPQGRSIAKQIGELIPAMHGITVRVGRVFLIDADESAEQVAAVANALLSDPIVERTQPSPAERGRLIEVHLKPGVMDPVAGSAEASLRDLGIAVHQVRTGRSFTFDRTLDPQTMQSIASRLLANGVIETVHFERFHPSVFSIGHEQPFELRHVPLRNLDDDALKKLSRDGHLFLSQVEMKAVQQYFRDQQREPTDIELETIAQTWSEHCVHKTLKSAVNVTEVDAAGKTVSTRRYGNLIKETIFASTQELMRSRTEVTTEGKTFPSSALCLSVFKDNAGVIVFDEDDAVCMKVETHNHPSAIEPYGGAATGIGGCIRDIMGTGLSAKPIASTNVFCVAYPDVPERTLPRGVIHPRRTLQQVVAGVRDYGNRMGIPTVNGAVYFDERFVGNPLVFCGCVGLIPRDKIDKAACAGDAIVVMGGRTGRDGIHGATFSSAELTDTHADEFSHAVQIGNAITQKQMLDVILQARDRGLFTAITDCGAGGLSSAVGEMAEKLGARVELDRVPLKYAGLRYDEIWISEAQERMVLSVPSQHVDELLKLSSDEDVEATVIGTFGTSGRELLLNYRGKSVGQISMAFLHDGLPMPTRSALVTRVLPQHPPSPSADIHQQLLAHLAHPNIASKHWIIRQYDHEVQGGSVIKPLTGPKQIGPSDAAVIRPKLNSFKGIALACGLSPQVDDPYLMAIASIDEAIRNVVAVGGKLDQLAILDNFCWPSVDDGTTMGTLVRACEACRDAALAYETPFISGKDSLHNQFTDSATGRVVKIPPTLLISAIAVIDDVRRCVTMDFKKTGSSILLVEALNCTDLRALAATHRAVSDLIDTGNVLSCHDVSDGGIAVAVAEMCIGSNFGATIDLESVSDRDPFVEQPGRYIVELNASADVNRVIDALHPRAIGLLLGTVQNEPRLHLMNHDWSVDEMTAAWRGTLDW